MWNYVYNSDNHVYNKDVNNAMFVDNVIKNHAKRNWQRDFKVRVVYNTLLPILYN